MHKNIGCLFYQPPPPQQGKTHTLSRSKPVTKFLKTVQLRSPDAYIPNPSPGRPLLPWQPTRHEILPIFYLMGSPPTQTIFSTPSATINHLCPHLSPERLVPPLSFLWSVSTLQPEWSFLNTQQPHRPPVLKAWHSFFVHLFSSSCTEALTCPCPRTQWWSNGGGVRGRAAADQFLIILKYQMKWNLISGSFHTKPVKTLLI